METVTQLDTHVVVWLYAGEVERLPQKVYEHLETRTLQISPMVVLELQYLFEIHRVAEPAEAVVSALRGSIGLTVSQLSFERVVEAALGKTWTRDPFDRLIVAQAEAEGVPLVTADKVIRKHYAAALWGRSRR